MKKAVGYVRVSTEEQAREGVSLSMQEAKIRLYAQTYELELVEIIRDEGLSAKSIKGRPGVQRALEMCYAGEVAALVVYKLDRLARNTGEALDIAEKLNRKGVSLQSVTEHLDTQSAIGRLYFTFSTAIATFEREVIGERTKAALDHKKANGKVFNHAPYGYDAVDGNLQANLLEQDSLQFITQRRNEGATFRQIADGLNAKKIPSKTGKAWTHAAVRKICARDGK